MVIDVQVECQFNGLEMLFVGAAYFDKVKALEKEGAQLSKAQQVAQARIVAGRKHHVSQHGSLVAENLVHIPNGAIYITSLEYSPFLKHASEAAAAQRNNAEVYISENEIEEIVNTAREDRSKVPAKQRVYTQKKTKSYGIPIKEFAKDPLAQFLFKETAADYAAFLQKANIGEVPVFLEDKEYQNSQKEPFARALWVDDLINWSGRGSALLGIGNFCSLRGVRKASIAQKISEPNVYETIVHQHGIKNTDELQRVLENTRDQRPC